LRDLLQKRVGDLLVDIFQVASLHVLVYAWLELRLFWLESPMPSSNVFYLGVPARMHSNNVPQVNAHSFQAKLRKWGDGFGKNRRQNKPQGNGLVKPVVATKALEPVSFTF
jgi:hypothetical protein